MNIPKTLRGFLWFFIRQQKFSFLILTVTAAVWAFNESFFPYFIKRIVNVLSQYHGDPNHVYQILFIPVIALILLWVLMEGCMRLQGFVLVYTFPKFRANIRGAVCAYIKKHSHSYFQNHFAGSIANKVQDLPSSSERLMEVFLFSFISLFVLLTISIVLMWETNVIFALVLLGWVSIHSSIVLFSLKKSNLYAKQHAEAITTLGGKIVDCITNIMNVRLFARHQYERDYLHRYQNDEIKRAQKHLFYQEKVRVILGILTLIFIFSMLFTLIYGWTKGWVSIGDFTLVCMLSFSIMGFTWFMSYQIGVAMREAGTISAALNLVSQPHEIQDAPQAKAIEIDRGEICFDRVDFKYHTGTAVFNKLSVTISAGQKVGLVGFSGSGKSTFVNLMLRFFDINSGRILVDQQNIANVNHDSLCQQISMIPQEPMLFHRSLMENIRYGDIEASDTEVIQAAKQAHCHEFISLLGDRYQTLVGERGIKLSGGQRQRIAIARGLLKNAPILILDEATASLDTVTEKLIQQSLNTLMRGRTTLVVAHRLSTLANMDRILVFQHGQIVEDATIDELLKNDGHFAKLWKMQSGGFLPEKELNLI